MQTQLAASARHSVGRSLRASGRATAGLRRRLPAPIKQRLRALRRRLPTRVTTALARLGFAGGAAAAPLKLPARPPVESTSVRLLIGPANFAGQGYQWARAVERHMPDISAQAFAFLNGRFDFPVDYAVSRSTYANLAWQKDQKRHVIRSYTHVLIEAERPLFGTLYGPECSSELPVLRKAGLAVALLAHGSDVRIPSHHVERYQWSPFRESDWEIIPTLEYNATRNAALLRGYEGHVLLSTPDLLDDIPNGVWCPVVVDPDVWATSEAPMSGERPVVVHAPSNSRMKGSELVDPIVQRLADAGLVSYRRITNVTPDRMPEVYRSADVVLDQFRLGSYGVAACEGMAAGRIVVGHVADNVRKRVLAATGAALPIVEATPATLEETLMMLVEDRERSRAIAKASTAFVRAVHDGRLSTDALTPFLAGIPRP